MIRFLARRVVLAIPVVFGVATLVFLLIHLVPGDPVEAMLGEGAAPAEVADLRARLGLDKPLLRQYGAFLAALARGNLGASLRTNQNVAEIIGERFPATVELAGTAAVMALLLAVPAGVAGAVRLKGPIDRIATVITLLGLSVPSFCLGPLLAIVFAVKLGWLPVSGRGTLAHLVLPALTLAAPLAAVLGRMTRASLLRELDEPYVIAARARGASGPRVVLHALRNGLIPIVTVFALQCGAVLTGTVITETIFAWPGVGRLLVQSIGFRDYPVVQGCVLLIALTYVAVNIAADASYRLLDPRIRSTRREA